MSRKEEYKRIVKFGSAAIIIFIEVGLYYLLWHYYLNEIIEVRFWRRGIWLLAALYGVLLIFFLQAYGGLKIGYLRRGNIIYSHMLSLVIVNVIGYLILALVDKKFHEPFSFIALTGVDSVIVVAWVFIFQWLYSTIFPPRRLLIVYGKRPVFSIMKKIGARDDKYIIGDLVSIDIGIDSVMERAKEFEGIVLGDMPSHERNLLLKKCYDVGMRVYMIPKISDILIRTSSNLNLFDTPILLSRNEGPQIDQLIVKRGVSFINLIHNSGSGGYQIQIIFPFQSFLNYF